MECCNQSFKDNYAYLKHVKEHTHNIMITCNLCGHTAKTTRALKTHFRRVHSNLPVNNTEDQIHVLNENIPDSTDSKLQHVLK
jgi:hypothetical protein